MMEKIEELKNHILYQRGIRKSYNISKGLELLNLEQLKDKTVLEVACGKGILSIFLSFYAKKVIGIDILEEEIKIANENKKYYEANNCEFYAHDILTIPLEQESFDIIVAEAALHHLIYDFRIGNKLHNLLKPNGKLVFISEPLSYNWISEFIRFVRHMRKHLFGEFQLWYEHIATFGQNFRKINYYYFDFFSHYFKFLEFLLPKTVFKSFMNFMWKFDNLIYKTFPFTKKYSPNVNIEMIK